MNTPYVIERTYDAPIEKVWQALIDPEKMKQWYFDIPDFKPVLGHEFEFYGGSKDVKFKHLLKITELVEGKKLAYTWRYEDLPGNSEVSFELFEEGDKTRLKLTHKGLESFEVIDNPMFGRDSFNKGWAMIIGTNLKDYLEK